MDDSSEIRDFGVFIGRFEPFHIAHSETVEFALKRCKHLIIVIGSANQARNTKNPWTAAERESMIRESLTENQRSRVSFIHAKDYLYNDNLWITAVQQSIEEITDGASSIVLFGHRKDASSFYLKLFPQWEFIETKLNSSADASRIRDHMFTLDKISVSAVVPKSVCESIYKFMETPEFQRLHEEYHHIAAYKEAWAGAPFPPTFNTVDAVVISCGHVLVVRRRGAPGRGLIALPGGFLNSEERIIDGAIRELKEETGIKLSIDELKKCVIDHQVFDHPNRSLRGRTITHAFCLKLPDGKLPQVKGLDDADKAWWMSLRDVFAQEDQFFEDHFHIINYFASRF